MNRLPRSTRNLTLILDDCLHGFPFAAINYEGKYLIERYAISFAYQERPTRARPRASRSALLVGASLARQGVRPLQFVSEELEAVESWVKNWRLTTENFDDGRREYPKPDKATIVKLLPQMAIAHFACHGLFIPSEPGKSGIVLQLRPKREVLTVQELSRVDLSDVLHITLSACWSADHFIFPGRWVVSLPETLERAGAASVLGCLWVVNDRIGATFMAQFYRYLNKYGRARALRKAQLECLNGKLKQKVGADVSQPIFWAGYQLYGERGTLRA